VGVARHLGVTKDSEDRLIEARRLLAHRIDRLWAFELSEVDEWVRTSGVHGHGGGDKDLPSILRSYGLVGDQDVESYTSLRRSAERRAVALPGEFSGGDEDARLLALGFGRGERGAPAVPYMRSPAA
jgi:hypothetical protein